MPMASVLEKLETVDVDVSTAESLRQELIACREILEDSYLNFAEKLYDVSRSRVDGDPAWKSWGFESFDEFSQKELGMKKAKAYYMVQIWFELVVNLGLSRDDLKEIDWTKARELAPLARAGILKPENMDEWMEKAKSLAVPQLIEEVRAAKRFEETREEVETETIHRLTFGLYEGQYNNLMRAMKAAEVATGSEKKGHLLDTIATEFNATYPGTDKTEAAAARLLESVERTFGVKIIGINKKDQVFHGKEHTE